MLQSVLGEIAESGAPGDLDFPGIGGHFPGQHPEQGGLTRPVLSTQTDAITGAQVPIDAGENPAAGKIFVYVPQLQHGGCYNTTCRDVKAVLQLSCIASVQILTHLVYLRQPIEP
jgi:hypothetical protein